MLKRRSKRTRNPGARAYPYADPVNQNKTITASGAQSIRQIHSVTVFNEQIARTGQKRATTEYLN